MLPTKAPVGREGIREREALKRPLISVIWIGREELKGDEEGTAGLWVGTMGYLRR